MKEGVSVTIIVSPTVQQWGVSTNQLHPALDELVRNAEAEPNWQVGKTYEVSGAVGGRPLAMALDYTPEGYKAFFAAEGELKRERPNPPSDN